MRVTFPGRWCIETDATLEPTRDPNEARLRDPNGQLVVYRVKPAQAGRFWTLPSIADSKPFTMREARAN